MPTPLAGLTLALIAGALLLSLADLWRARQPHERLTSAALVWLVVIIGCVVFATMSGLALVLDLALALAALGFVALIVLVLLSHGSSSCD